VAYLTSSDDFGKRICLALGLDPVGVASINLRIAAGDLITAEVKLLLSKEEADGVLEVVTAQKFVLEKLP
jgi:hypothetical protein